VIVPPTGIRVLVATKPVDFRKGMDGLAAYVQLELQSDPFCGVVYVFRAKRADRVKLLFWDQTGLCLLTKRLECVIRAKPATDSDATRPPVPTEVGHLFRSNPATPSRWV
jgi:transposase